MKLWGWEMQIFQECMTLRVIKSRLIPIFTPWFLNLCILSSGYLIDTDLEETLHSELWDSSSGYHLYIGASNVHSKATSLSGWNLLGFDLTGLVESMVMDSVLYLYYCSVDP